MKLSIPIKNERLMEHPINDMNSCSEAVKRLKTPNNGRCFTR